MEQDWVPGLYRSLGMSVGAELSSEDVSLLYHKVFHVPSNTDEAHAAMKKIAGGDSSWSCAGENILDVLLEIEVEREKKEKLYWDLQLLNVGNLNTLYAMDKPVIIDPHVLSCLRQSADPNAFKEAHNSDTGFLHTCTTDSDGLQTERLEASKELHESARGVKRLKKATRHCWIRLASEGVHSILPSPWHDHSLRVKGQAWGCVSLSDVLLLVEVKYDVMTHLLYTEMLQEHHTPSVWETLLPWQRHKEEEGLEDMAEEALESDDMLRLAELPGAFRIYKTCLDASFRNCPESSAQSWSAASFLYELHTSHQQERDTLMLLGEGLDGGSLRLLCLYIRLATLRARREKLSYGALLAARQSWETWPHVNSACRVEQAALWLRDEEQEQSEDLISPSPQQQAVLQLLVLIQEQERKYLVKLLQGISLEDLQGPGCTVASGEDTQKQCVLRNGCIKRLRQIHGSLQAHTETQTPFGQTDSLPHSRHQTQAHMCSKPAVWSQSQLEDCVLLLLTHLLELQEVQASTLLPVLIDKSAQRLQGLREEYESEHQAQRNANLIQLLISDAPLASGSMLTPSTKGSSELKKAQPRGTGQLEAQNVGAGPAEASAVVSVTAVDRELNGVQAAGVTDKQDVCTGCGAAMEELPYLEILCVSDATSQTHQSLSAEGGAQGEEEGSAATGPQSYEKQGSLITLAWSKPPEEDVDTEAADGGAGRSRGEEAPGENHVEKLKPASLHSGSTSPRDAPSAELQRSAAGQLTSEERRAADPPQRGEAALEKETLQVVEPRLLFDPPEFKPHADDLRPGLTDEMAEGGRDGVEGQMCATATESELRDPMGPEPTPPEGQEHSSQATFGCGLAEREAVREFTLMGRERAGESVSAVERERTMRNLVDMQRKVEQRQQRDRERQLLRVQERLSIVQNRKAEEDLLGLKHTDRLRHVTQDLPQEDKTQQKTVVRERLEQLRRERSYVMQSKRDRNTAGFKELLGPVALHSGETEEEAD